MRRPFSYAVILAASALCGSQLASQPSVDDANRKLASYGLPAIDKVHQPRSNCHNAYDLLFAEKAKGLKTTSEELNFAGAYEAARGTKPCPAPPAGLAARANGHVLETQQGMAGVAGYAVQQKDPVALFEGGLAMWVGKFGAKEVQEGYSLISQAAGSWRSGSQLQQGRAAGARAH